MDELHSFNQIPICFAEIRDRKSKLNVKIHYTM